MYIIAGLGNPDARYQNTRHNAGFDAIDVIAEKNHIPLDTIKYNALSGSGFIGGQKEDELLVIYDDISLEPGKLRLRRKGSAGGHNGIKNIIAHLGTEKFKRIKIGVGSKPEGWDLKDFVLGHFSKEDQALMQDAFSRTADAVDLIVADEFDKAMNTYN